jgi:hypothetical protein
MRPKGRKSTKRLTSRKFYSNNYRPKDVNCLMAKIRKENSQLQKILCMVRKALSSMSKFGVRTPLVSNKLSSLSKYPNSISFAVFEVKV